jgi:hypothetical protein
MTQDKETHIKINEKTREKGQRTEENEKTQNFIQTQ